jgi:type VI secretion system protein VasJ
LALAKLCAAAGQRALAQGLFEALDQESLERGLDGWDPTLAAEVLEGFLQMARQPGSKISNGVGPDTTTARFHRLCKLDPAAALRVGA